MVIWCCQVFTGLLGEYSWHSSAHDYDVGRCGILFSEAQREGVFLALQYIVFTFDFLRINLVIWAQLQVHYLILVLTNGMNRIKKKSLSALIDLLDTCESTWFFFKLGLWQDAFWKLSRDTCFGMTKSPGPPYGYLTHGSNFPLDCQNKSFLDLHLM